MPNAQLIRRRIDYQETAEYRMVDTDNAPPASTSHIIKQVTGSHTKPLTVDVDDDARNNPRRATTVTTTTTTTTAADEKFSSG